MGRWLASLRAEEKNTKIALRRTDKTVETFPDRILSVLSVPSPGIPEKFSSRAASFGSLEAKAFRQLDLGAWLRKTAASSTGLKINQGKPKGVPGGYQ